MKTRIITAVVALICAVPVIMFSGTIALPAVMSMFSLIGAFEMLRCVGYHKIYSVSVPSLLLAGAVPIAAFYMESERNFIFAAVITFYVFLLYLLCVSVLNNGALKVSDVCIAYASCLYIIVGFTCIVLLRRAPNGQYLFMLAFISAWLTDIFAYFIGVTFGRHKLIEKVSPKKTVEGAVGGIVFCAAGFVAYGEMIGYIWGVKPNVLMLMLLGIVLSVISQFGDLIASLIKRQYGIKDYGKFFPGHGGVLDRFDSTIAISPILLILCWKPEILAFFI